MSIRIDGADELVDLLLSVESTTRRRSVKTMIEAGEELRDLARQMAPVDEGNLESAIKLNVSAARDERGRFQARSVEVYIDMNMDATPPGAAKPKTVGDYAYAVHELVTPAGPKGLGKRSLAKQAGSSVQVGGGFLERAAEEVEERFVAGQTRALDESL